MKINFFDTKLAKTAGFSRHTGELIAKLAKESSSIVLKQYEVNNLIDALKKPSDTALFTMFENLCKSNAVNSLSILNFATKNTIIPELILHHIPLDLKSAEFANIISNLPELKGRVIVNVTSSVSYDRLIDGCKVKDIQMFAQEIVWGHLIGIYNDSDYWLSSSNNLITFIKSYSKILSKMITSHFNLDIFEAMRIAGYFAVYMLTRVKDDVCLDIPTAFNRCDWCWNYPASKQAIEDDCRPYLASGNYEIDTVCELISHVNPKLKDFKLSTLYQLTERLAGMSLRSKIALEYPPEWLYTLFVATNISANVGMRYTLDKDRALMKECQDMVKSIALNENLTSPRVL